MVHVRLEHDVKAGATETLAAMGLTVSDAVRVFLMRVVAEQQPPFPLKVPNAETRAIQSLTLVRRRFSPPVSCRQPVSSHA